MQLTKNFHIDEFESKDGAEMPEDVFENIGELAENLQVIRNYVKAPIKVNSGYRSPSHNEAVGGVSDSQHVKGNAADIVIEKVVSKQLFDIIERMMDEGKIGQGGIGLYSTFVHYDIRGHKVTWEG